VVVLNKVDLLAEAQVDEQISFVRDGVERLLGFRPDVFPVSARLAVRGPSDPDWAASRFEPLQSFISRTLDERGRLVLKLSTPLGIGERIARTYVIAAEDKLALLAADLAVVDSIERQLGAYRDDMRREFNQRLEAVDNVLHEMSARGVDYLDRTLRLGRVIDLFRQKLLKEEFERIVVADTPERLDRISQDTIDWMVDQDLRLWRNVTEQVDRRRGEGIHGSAERLAGSFEYDRRALLASLGQTARGVLQRHDHQREANQLASSVRDAVMRGTLLEASAIGLGAVSMAIVGSAAADVTGLFAASVLAGVGLWLLPRKRGQAKAQFRTRTEELRTRLMTALRDEFARELERSVQRIRDALAPYDRLVRSEQERTLSFVTELQSQLAATAELRARVDSVARDEHRAK
jgi:hypothetical protein